MSLLDGGHGATGFPTGSARLPRALRRSEGRLPRRPAGRPVRAAQPQAGCPETCKAQTAEREPQVRGQRLRAAQDLAEPPAGPQVPSDSRQPLEPGGACGREWLAGGAKPGRWGE